MRKAISSSWVVFTSLYMCVGCLGYSAFGDKTPINLLTKTGVYGFFNPYWLIDAGNMFVMLRMVGAYQVSTCCLQRRSSSLEKCDKGVRQTD